MRAFIALPVPQEIRAAVRGAQAALAREFARADLKWQAVEKSHLTLRFLGEVSEGELTALRSAVDATASATRRFALTPGDLGAFPDSRRPRVLWLAVEGETERLARLKRVLEENLETVGVPPTADEFTPHLTLARIRRLPSEDRGRLAALSGSRPWARLANPPSDRPTMWRVATLQLLRSRLGPNGAAHSVLHEAELSLADDAG